MCVCGGGGQTLKLYVRSSTVILSNSFTVEGVCRNGWTRFDDSCYWFEDLHKTNWTLANVSRNIICKLHNAVYISVILYFSYLACFVYRSIMLERCHGVRFSPFSFIKG